MLTPSATASMMMEVYRSFGTTTHVPAMVEPLMNKGATAVLLPGLAELLDVLPAATATTATPATTSSASSVSAATAATAALRRGEIHRATKETSIDVVFNIDGTGTTNISTGIGFFDHMLDA